MIGPSIMKASRIVENEFFIINLGVLSDRRLTANEKLLFAYISNYWSNGRDVWASNSVLAETLGTSKKTINNALMSLKHYGYICTKYETINGKRYRIIYKYKTNDQLTAIFESIYSKIQENKKGGKQW